MDFYTFHKQSNPMLGDDRNEKKESKWIIVYWFIWTFSKQKRCFGMCETELVKVKYLNFKLFASIPLFAYEFELNIKLCVCLAKNKKKTVSCAFGKSETTIACKWHYL